MAVVKPSVFADVAAAFSGQLPEFVWTAAPQEYIGEIASVPSLADLGQTDAGLHFEALAVFVLGLRDAGANTGIGAAIPGGWRFFVGNAAGKILMGTVSRKLPSEGWKLTAGYYGEQVWSAYQAMNDLEQLEQVRAADYELRILVIPGLNLEAFWLAALTAGGADLVVPYPAMPNQPIEALSREPVFTMANFLAAIRPVARLRLTAESKYGG